jgi:hypothetical protein
VEPRAADTGTVGQFLCCHAALHAPNPDQVPP